MNLLALVAGTIVVVRDGDVVKPSTTMLLLLLPPPLLLVHKEQTMATATVITRGEFIIRDFLVSGISCWYWLLMVGSLLLDSC